MKNYSFVLGLTILFLAFSAVFITSLVFLFGGHMVPVIAWASVALTVIFAFVASKRLFKHYILVALCILAIIFTLFYVSILINGKIYDISYDGQTYQQEAVIQLAQGWNPDYQYLDPNVIGLDQKWIDYYPKSAWINEAYIYMLSGNIETGKAMNMILLFASIALVYAAIVEVGLMNPLNAFFVSLLVAANPVNIYEMFTYYVDSQLMTLFTCLAALLMIAYMRKHWLALLGVFMAATLLVNVKFTGALDAVLLIGVFVIIIVRSEHTEIAKKGILVSLAALLVGGFLMGFSPYVTNIVRYGNPGYPLEGTGAIDLKPYNVPGDYIDKNSLQIMFLSFFAQSDTLKGVGTTSTYKLPFTYSPAELTAFRYTDQQEGGFGPLFGGIIIISGLIIASYFIFRPYFRKKPKYGTMFWVGIMAIAFIILMSVINPISSLARYVPQAYLLAVIPIIILMSFRRPFPVILGYVVMGLVFYNSYLIANVYVNYALTTSATWKTELTQLATDSQTAPVQVLFNEFKSNRIVLQEAGINYTTVPNAADCVNPQELLPESTTDFCNVPAPQ